MMHEPLPARVSVEKDPERNCSDLLLCIAESGGLCVYVTDAVKTDRIRTRRLRGGSLPTHNVARKAQFRVMHPQLHLYKYEDYPKDAPPILISRLRASTGFGNSQLELDLGDSQDLAVLIYPIAKKRRLSGFFIVAVHYNDLHLFDGFRKTACVNRQDGMELVFSWATEQYEKVPDEELERKLSGQPELDFDDDLSQQRVRWQPGSLDLDEDCA